MICRLVSALKLLLCSNMQNLKSLHKLWYEIYHILLHAASLSFLWFYTFLHFRFILGDTLECEKLRFHCNLYIKFTNLCPDECWCWHIVRCQSNSCFPGMVYADVNDHHGISLLNRSQWCTPDYPSYQGP